MHIHLKSIQSKLLTCIENEANLKKIHAIHLDKEAVFETCHLLVSGQWNAGKSSLINALINHENLLTTAITPETSRLIHLVNGENLNYFESELEYLKRNTCSSKRAVQLMKEPSDQSLWIEVDHFPFEQHHLIDMPGANATIEAHQNVFKNQIQNAHMLLYVISALQPIQREDLIQLKYLSLFIPTDQIFIVFSQTSFLNKEEQTMIVQRLIELLPEFQNRYFLVDSVSFFDPSKKHISGIPELQSILKKILQKSVKSFVEKTILQQFHMVCTSELNFYDQKIKNFENLVHQKEQDLKDTLFQLTMIESEIKFLESSIKYELHTLISQQKNHFDTDLQSSEIEVKKMCEHHQLQFLQQEIILYYQNLYENHLNLTMVKIKNLIKEHHLENLIDQLQQKNQTHHHTDIQIDIDQIQHEMSALSQNRSLFGQLDSLIQSVDDYLPTKFKLAIDVLRHLEGMFQRDQVPLNQSEILFHKIQPFLIQNQRQMLAYFTNWLNEMSQQILEKFIQQRLSEINQQKQTIQALISNQSNEKSILLEKNQGYLYKLNLIKEIQDELYQS